ncbi:MAG: ABC transporter permease [Acidobacteriota bacterium]
MPLSYLLRRLASALMLVAVVSSGAMVLTLLAPGDFTSELAFETDQATLARRRSELGLDRPILVQYVDWVRRAARLDFGQSLLYARPVSTLVGERALNTAALAAAALAIATLAGIPLGLYTGTRLRGARVVRAASLVLLSTPPLVASLALVLVAARTGWFPVGGMGPSDRMTTAGLVWLAEAARHLILPALALALPLAATLERVQSAAIQQAMGEPFVRAAEARGLSHFHAAMVHGWRSSLGTVLGLYGLIIGGLFSGSFVVEVVTSWPGLGRLMYDGLRARDLYLVAGCAATGAVFLAVGTLLSDLLLATADPRTRMGHRA